MNFNFGKLVKKLLSRKRNDVAAHAKAPVIEQQPMNESGKRSAKFRSTKRFAAVSLKQLKVTRRKMAQRSRTLNSMRRRGKLCV